MTEVLTDDATPVAATPARQGGVLLAVCGLCGGAGASTLAYLLGAAVAAPGSAPVLVCDAGEPTAGLSAYANVESLHTLGELADGLSSGRPIREGLFAEARPGLRLIASAPRLHEDADPLAVDALLRDAREEHALTIVDCGGLATAAGRIARESASHLAWVLPATVSGLVRARRMLALYEPDPRQRELLVARFDAGGRQPPLAELTELADSRHARLALMPHVPDLGEHPCEQALEEAQVTLEAITSLIRR